MKRYLVLVAALFFLVSEGAFAHSAMTSLEATEGEYRIDIGYEPEELRAQEMTLFDLAIFGTNSEQVTYSNVWFRIETNEQTVFASGIHKPAYGGTTVIYTFPKEGAYTLSVRFEHEGAMLAEHTFSLTVLPKEKAMFFDQSRMFILGSVLCAGSVALFFVTWTMWRRKIQVAQL